MHLYFADPFNALDSPCGGALRGAYHSIPLIDYSCSAIIYNKGVMEYLAVNSRKEVLNRLQIAWENRSLLLRS